MDLPLKGSCLCGSVRVTVTSPPLLSFACHCRDCQKFSASDYSLSILAASDEFSCSGALIKGGLGTSERAHYFCKSCLTFVYSQVGTSATRVNLRTSVLDDADAFAPFVELMTEEKRPWSKTPAVHSFATVPDTPERLQALLEDYAALLSTR